MLGWDAAGTVEAVGPEATLFKPGDAVYYAGDVTRPGANSELHLVDERIVGRKPKRLDFAQAAAIPLTAITAWEAFFDRMKIDRGGKDSGKTHPHHRRRGRRRLDRHPAREARRPAGHRHGVASASRSPG